MYKSRSSSSSSNRSAQHVNNLITDKEKYKHNCRMYVKKHGLFSLKSCLIIDVRRIVLQMV